MKEENYIRVPLENIKKMPKGIFMTREALVQSYIKIGGFCLACILGSKVIKTKNHKK